MSEVILSSAQWDGPTVPVHPVTPAALPACLEILPAPARTFAKAIGFSGKSGEILCLPDADGGVSAVLFGMGSPDDPGFSPLLTGALPHGLPEGAYAFSDDMAAKGVNAGMSFDGRLGALGFGLGAYRFDAYRKPVPCKARLVASDDIDLADLRRVTGAVFAARDLINRPANDLAPADLAAALEALAGEHRGEFRQVGGDELQSGFPLIHAVGAASDRPPLLADMAWGDPAHPKVTLVGKGVVFDSGGLDIKSAVGMALMKKDMGGAAAVIGLAAMIMDAGLPVRLRVLIPAVENAISGRAFRPGDIFRSRKGLTVEIGNTDAEGRLVLADALALAGEEDPDLVISMATLTGAARVALGPDVPPLFTKDDSLADEILAAAESERDPVWRMPLWRPYDRWLRSKVADLNHVGGKAFAGATVAALFLDRFVDPAAAYAHFDIFGWVPEARPWAPVGGEAQAIRALYRALARRYGDPR